MRSACPRPPSPVLSGGRGSPVGGPYGVTLPASCRDFLGTVAAGGSGPHYGLLGLAEEVADEAALHDLRTECLRADFLAASFPHTTDWPGPGGRGDADYSVAGTLVLGEIGCGTFSRLGGRSGSTTAPGAA
ncbi:hypothetical protein RKD19_007372 [Streptomyces canus]